MAPPQGRGAGRELSPDVVVLGGGLAGCSLARFLAEAGHAVVLVERGGIAAGASGRNGGYLFRQPADWINDLLDDSVAIYRELEDDGPISFDLREETLLLLAAEPGELAHARTYADATGGTEHDTAADPWLADDLAGGFLIPGGYILDPLGATVAMAEAARRAGAELRPGTTAARILTVGARVTGVATDQGVISSERVVVATGPRARFVLRSAGVDLPISATRGWLVETAPIPHPPPYAIEQALWPTQAEMGPLASDPTLADIAAGPEPDAGIVSLLLGVHGTGQLRIGTSLSRSLREEPEDERTPRRLAERAVRVAPHLAGIPVTAAWSGRRAVTPDGLPAVGAVPGTDGLDLATGFSSIGMVTIPAACRRFAEGELQPAFDPARLG